MARFALGGDGGCRRADCGLWLGASPCAVLGGEVGGEKIRERAEAQGADLDGGNHRRFGQFWIFLWIIHVAVPLLFWLARDHLVRTLSAIDGDGGALLSARLKI